MEITKQNKFQFTLNVHDLIFSVISAASEKVSAKLFTTLLVFFNQQLSEQKITADTVISAVEIEINIGAKRKRATAAHFGTETPLQLRVRQTLQQWTALRLKEKKRKKITDLLQTTMRIKGDTKRNF